MSDDEATRLSIMIRSFFVCAYDVLLALRSPLSAQQAQGHSKESDKDYDWFGLEIPHIPSEALQLWVVGDLARVPPLVLETVLDLSRLSPSESIMFEGGVVNTHKKSEIVLERWLFHLNLDDYSSSCGSINEIRENIVVQFRCLYALMMLLPSYSLRHCPQLNHTEIKVKVLDGSKPIPSKGRFGLSKRLVNGYPNNIKSEDLDPIVTPIGSLNISVSFRAQCDFGVQLNEQVFSQRMEPQSVSNSIASISSAHQQQPHTDIPINRPHRVSVTSIESARSRRKSSIRSSSLFKTGSLASSSSPPQSQAISLTHTQLQQQQQQSSHPYNHATNQLGRELSSLSINSNSKPETPGLDSSAIKISSSFGSKFKSNNGSIARTNTIDDRVSHSNSKNIRNRLLSSLSVDSDSDDLTGFMKLLDSKPDLRFSGSGFISQDNSISDVLEDYRSLRNTGVFKEVDYQQPISGVRTMSPPPTATTDKNVSDSVVRLLAHSPLSSSPRGIVNAELSRNPSRSSMNHGSPKSASMKASAIAGTSNVGVLAATTKIKRGSNSSSPNSTTAANSAPVNHSGSESLIERLRRGSIGSQQEHQHSGTLIPTAPEPGISVSSQLRYVLSHSKSRRSSSVTSQPRSAVHVQADPGVDLKSLCYGQEVFDSDDDEDHHGRQRDHAEVDDLVFEMSDMKN